MLAARTRYVTLTRLGHGGYPRREAPIAATPMNPKPRPTAVPSRQSPPEEDLLRELVAHLRQNRTALREEWIRRILEAKRLAALSRDEIYGEASSVYDNYVEVLETGNVDALARYARGLSERTMSRGV